MNQNNSVQISPKYMFGANADIKNSLHLIDDKKLVYVAGHNVVITKLEDRSQTFLAGSSDAEAITAIALSFDLPATGGGMIGQYLAMCQRAGDYGRLVVFDLQKTSSAMSAQLPLTVEQIQSVQSKEMIAVAFSCKDYKKVVTLTGEPNYNVMLWDWQASKLIAKCGIGLTGSLPMDCPNSFMLSWNPFDFDNSTIVVTGPQNTFKYIKQTKEESVEGSIDQKFSLVAAHTQINNKADNKLNSEHFMCHSWDKKTALLLVCTEAGEMIVLQNTGEFKAKIHEGPFGRQIEACLSFSKGYILGVEDNFFFFECDDEEDERVPLTRIADAAIIKMAVKETMVTNDRNNKIQAMVINSDETCIYVLTQQGQVIYCDLKIKDFGMDEKNPVEQFIFNYFISQFHREEITGLDVCTRKQLIATCSKDKTVNIWNVKDRCLEIEPLQCSNEECTALAFHPSGLHLLVAVTDKIMVYNLRAEKLTKFKEWPIKNCCDIKFSNGGHLFAAVCENKEVRIFDFYKGESPEFMQFDAQKVACIDWYENDMGFTTCGIDGNIYFFDLFVHTQEGKGRNTDMDYIAPDKGTKYSMVQTLPSNDKGVQKPYECIAVGTDKRIIHVQKSKNAVQPSKQTGSTCDPAKLDASYSAICMMKSGKAVIAGVGELNRPGELQVWKLPLQCQDIIHVQAHSKAVTKLKTSFDQQQLYSGGEDGIVAIYDLKDRDPLAIKPEMLGKGAGKLLFSEEILTDKAKLETLFSERDMKLQEYEQINPKSDQSKDIDQQITLKRQTDDIDKLITDIDQNEEANKQKIDSLMEHKREAEANNSNKRKELLDKQQTEMEKKRNEYSSKMLEDASLFQQLQARKDQGRKIFQDEMDMERRKHEQKVQAQEKQHQASMEQKLYEIENCQEQILTIKKENAETIRQMIEDAKFETTDIQTKNKSNQVHVQDMTLKSRAELQLTKNKLKEIKTDIDTLERTIGEKSVLITKQEEKNKTLYDDASDLDEKIGQKDKLIGNREKKIYGLKKKTQELEKFKFVLDFKIKDLNRDIAPKELKIQELSHKTWELDEQLMKYNQTNAQAGFKVDNLRINQELMTDEIAKYRTIIRKNTNSINQQKNAVYWVVQNTDDHEQLKKSINEQLYEFVKDQEIKSVEVDSEIRKEYESQKNYLENCVKVLTKRQKAAAIQTQNENKSIMQSNRNLIDMITRLRSENAQKTLRFQAIQDEKHMKLKDVVENAKKAHESQQEAMKAYASGGQGGYEARTQEEKQQTTQIGDYLVSVNEAIGAKRTYIDDLHRKIEQLKGQNQQLQMMGQGKGMDDGMDMEGDM